MVLSKRTDKLIDDLFDDCFPRIFEAHMRCVELELEKRRDEYLALYLAICATSIGQDSARASR